jgi:hypothetical protein
MECKSHRDGLPGLPLYARVGLPVEWDFGEKPSDGIGGPRVEDAGAFHVAVGTDSEYAWDDGAVFSFTIADLVSDLLDSWGATEGDVPDLHAPAAKRLIDELRRVANALESKLPT